MKKLFFILIVVLGYFAIAHATEIRDDMTYTGEHIYNGVIMQRTLGETSGTSLCFEGLTENAFETCFLITDPTADRVVTFGDSSYTAGATNAHSDLVTITKVTAGTNTVQDAITMDISGADTTTGFGAGVVWKLEDDTGTTTEEHGSIDVVITTPTSTTEDSDMVFKHMVNGDVTETFRLVAAEAADAGDYFQFTSNTTELNAEITTGMFKLLSVGTELAGLGATHEYWMVDAGGSEIQAEFATVFTTITTAQEDVDLVWRQNDNGTVSETLRLVADADGTAEGTRMEITSRSAETNDVNDLIVLKASGGTTVADFGVGIDMQAEFADGVETACKFASVWTDVGTGSEDADWVVSCKDAGAVQEVWRVASGGNAVLSGVAPSLTIGDAGAEDSILIFDGSAEDYHVGIYDTNDDLVIGLGAAPGTTDNIVISDSGTSVPTVTLFGHLKDTERYTTEGGANTLTLAECGLVFSDADGTPATTHTLPAISGSAGCEFMFINASDSADDDTVESPEGDNIVCMIDVDNSSYSIIDADKISFVDTADTVGDFVICVSDGVDWFCRGVGEATGSITCTG